MLLPMLICDVPASKVRLVVVGIKKSEVVPSPNDIVDEPREIVRGLELLAPKAPPVILKLAVLKLP